MTAIENQYIKGLSVKLLVGIILSTATIVASVLGIYYNIKSDLSKLTVLDKRITTLEESSNNQQRINFEVEKKFISLENAINGKPASSR